MNEANIISQKEAAQRAMSGSNLISFGDRTIRENIDLQIQQAIDNVERLKGVKASMEKSGLLDVKIGDLRQAMNY
jgi:hypothetical protein